jgi:ferrous iron transport protein A
MRRYDANHSHQRRQGVQKLSDLASGACATVIGVDDLAPRDAIASRLRDLGFVAGEPISLVTRGPFGGDPLLVAIGGTRFALRTSEAARVRVEPGLKP